MNITLTVDFTGSPDAEDQRAARRMVFLKNVERASQSPPLAPLPFGTAPELRASYLSILSGIATAAHLSYIQQTNQPQAIQELLTSDQMQQLSAAVVTRLQAGTSFATLLADVQS